MGLPLPRCVRKVNQARLAVRNRSDEQEPLHLVRNGTKFFGKRISANEAAVLGLRYAVVAARELLEAAAIADRDFASCGFDETPVFEAV